jgi:hypothetical protein
MEDLCGCGCACVTTLGYVCSSDGVSDVAAASRCVCCARLRPHGKKDLNTSHTPDWTHPDIHIGDVKKAAHEGAAVAHMSQSLPFVVTLSHCHNPLS